jgi:hypothetical protein
VAWPKQAPRRDERFIVWIFCFIAAAILLVLAGMDLADPRGGRRGGAWGPVIGGSAALGVLVLGGVALWLIRNTFTSYAPPLVMLSAVVLANEVRVMSFGLLGNEIFLGLVITVIVVVWQAVALAVLLERWRELVPVRGRRPWFEQVDPPAAASVGVPMAKAVTMSALWSESPIFPLTTSVPVPPSPIDLPPPPQVVAYAQPVDGAAVSEPIRPLALLAGNVLAVVLPFVKFTQSESPFDVIVGYARNFSSRGVRAPQLWDAMITAPFLLALPLAGWTVRLCRLPRASRAQRGVAWGVTCSSAAVTAVVTGYCGTQLWQHPRFVPAFLTTLTILALTAVAVRSLRRVMWSYAPALLAMTGASAANTAMTVLVVVSHQRWNAGTVIGAAVVLLQLGGAAVVYFRWRREAPPPT